MALAIYDPDLPEPLSAELRRVKSAMAEEEDGEPGGEPTTEATGDTLTEELKEDLGRLRGNQERTAWKVKDIEEELRRRGVEVPEFAERAPSDSTWERWVSEDAID
jgi:hypothetical protein